jgi:hypothetical protein
VQIIRRASKIVVLYLVALIAVDLLLFLIGDALGGGFSVSVWGTYAAWASAITPPVALAATVVTWMEDRRSREDERIDKELFRVRVEIRLDGAWLVNDSSYAIATEKVLMSSGEEDRLVWVPSGRDMYLGAADEFRKVRVIVMRASCEVEIGKPGCRLL